MKPIPKSISSAVYLRYLLLNLPGLVGLVLVLIIIRQWFALPGWLFWVLIACWVVKDVVLFPFVWRAYEPNELTLTGSMVGKRGIVKTPLNPAGYVQVRGELWRAERAGGGPPIEVGRVVHVQQMAGLTLYVVPEEEEEEK